MARGRGIGAVIGIGLACAGIGVLFWNEGRSVARLDTIEAGRDALVEADPARREPDAPDRLLHLVGEAQGDRVEDATFGVALTALRLDRKVEMYQWVERTRNRDGGTEYSYTKQWRDSRQTGFKHPTGHVNPAMVYRSQRFYAGEPRLGAYRLSRTLLDDLDATETVTPAVVTVAKLPPLTLVDATLYSGEPRDPGLGDYRIGFTAVPAQPVSVLAAVAGGVLVPFRVPDGELAMIEPGAMTADAMFGLAVERNSVLTWGLRVAGTVAIFIGLMVVLRSAVSWLPFAQGLARKAAALLALLLAVPLAISAIAFSWLWYRPLWAIPLLLLASAVPVGLALRERRRQPARAAALASPPPPPR